MTLVCAKQGHIHQLDGELLRAMAHYNESPEQIALLRENSVHFLQSLSKPQFLREDRFTALVVKHVEAVRLSLDALGRCAIQGGG